MAGPFELGLGETKPSKQGLGYLQPADVNLSGFQRAASALAGIGSILEERQTQAENFKITTDIGDFQTEVTKGQQTAADAAVPGDLNISKKLDEQYTKAEERFLASQPAHRQAEVQARLTEFRQHVTLQNEKIQYDRTNTYARDKLAGSVVQGQNYVGEHPDTASLRDTKERYFAQVDESPLPEVEKLKLKRDAEQLFAKTSASVRIREEHMSAVNPERRTDWWLARADPQAVASGHIDERHLRGMNSDFAKRAMTAIEAAEAATGSRATVTSTWRSHAEQADAYRRSAGGTKFMAARPGRSRHERGAAVDVARGPVLTWLRSKDPATGRTRAEAYGVVFPFEGDVVHMQAVGPVAPMQAAEPTGDRAAVLRAIIQQESRGNPNAIGAAGEVGLMQIMPSTAALVAREMGDKSFPQGGSPADVREYMLRPGMSEKYGTYLFESLLRRYGGDVRTALIAYNGGQGAGDSFRRNGTAPRAAMQYADNVLARLDGGVSGFNWDDPAYASVPWDDREAIYNDAVSKANALNNAAETALNKQIRDEANDLLVRIDQGQAGQQQVDSYLDKWGDRTFEEDVHKMLVRLGEKNAQTNLTNDFGEKLKSTEGWDPQAKRDKDMQNAAFKSGGGAALLQSGDEAYVRNTFLPNAERTGMIAPDAASVLTGMARSGTHTTMVRGLNILAQLEDRSPLAYANATDENVQKLVTAWRHGNEVLSPDELARTVRGMGQTAEDRAIYKDRMEFIEKVQKGDPNDGNYLSTDEVVDALGGEVRLELNNLTERQLQQELTNAYQDQYARTGDVEAAKRGAIDLLRMNWGVTTFGGEPSLMKYPPEKYWAPVAGNHGWMEEQARTEAAAHGYTIRPGEKVALIADAQSRPRNGPPSYVLVKQGTDGAWRTVYPDDQRQIFAITPELQARQQAWNEVRQADAQIAKLQAERLEALRQRRSADAEALEREQQEWQRRRDEAQARIPEPATAPVEEQSPGGSMLPPELMQPQAQEPEPVPVPVLEPVPTRPGSLETLAPEPPMIVPEPDMPAVDLQAGPMGGQRTPRSRSGRRPGDASSLRPKG